MQGVTVPTSSAPGRLDYVQASGGVQKSVVLWSGSLGQGGVTGYRIEARRNAGAYWTVKTVAGSERGRTTVRNLRKGNYRFRVRALRGEAAGPGKVSWVRVRVRAKKLPTRYYTFRSRRDSSYMTLRVMSDRTTHGVTVYGMEYVSYFGRLSKGRITGKMQSPAPRDRWRQAKTGKWNNLQLKGYQRVKKSKSLSGHKNRYVFRKEIRQGDFPKN